MVGERCTVNCIVNNKPSKLLLDTGAQLSIINKDKLESDFFHVSIQDISSILDSCNSFRVQWGDEENIPFVVCLDMSVNTDRSVKTDRDRKIAEVNLPFLVTTQKMKPSLVLMQ